MTTPSTSPSPSPSPIADDDQAAPTRRIGVWRAALSGWRVFIPVIGLNAGIQAALVTSDPVPLVSWSFGLLLVGSAAAIVVTVWLVSFAALAGVDGNPRPPQLLRRPSALAWAAGWGVLTVAVAVLAWWAAPLAVIIGALVLPGVNDGHRHPLAAAARTVRRQPLRAAVFALGVLLLTVVSWVVQLLLGFFVTGAVAAAVTWVWLGVVVVLVLCWSSSLYRRATPML